MPEHRLQKTRGAYAEAFRPPEICRVAPLSPCARAMASRADAKIEDLTQQNRHYEALLGRAVEEPSEESPWAV